MFPNNKNWTIEGDELEEHLASDCELTIIEPMQTAEYFTTQERELLAQFPKDQPEVPEYDEVLRLDLVGARGVEIPEKTASFLLGEMADEHEHVGKVFKTARFWCLRVKHV
tara:strand:- start:2551 stop:2883 length:333 start_codon:yes stop_codon:yes gene_type:complete